MSDHEQQKRKEAIQRQQDTRPAKEGLSASPPAFQLQAQPIQRQEPSTPAAQPPQAAPAAQAPAPSLYPSLLDPAMIRQLVQGMNATRLQLQPTLSLMSPEERERALIQNLRNRLPFVGSVLPTSWVLSMWQIDPRSTTETADGPQRTYDLLSGPQLDEQMMINRILRRDFPDPLGWRPALSEHGVGASYLQPNGNQFTFGARPTAGGFSAGLEYRF